MFSRTFFIPLYAVFIILILLPARSTAAIYSWQDANGVVTFTDDLSRAPGNVRVKVLSAEVRPQTAPAGLSAAAAPAPNPPSRVATEGEFVVQLVEELGLSEDPSAEEAADLLTEIRVAPQLGRWELDRPMTEDLTVRLRKLTVAAAESGRITLTPDEVLLAFDTTAALLGLTIPVAIEPEAEEASQEPLSLAETPPLVYVTPPPAVIYPYYTWFPVSGGFWWNGFLCSGFFVLDVNHFSGHRGFRGHRGSWDSGHIGRQFRNHIADRHFVRNPSFSNTGRRFSTRPGQAPVSNRFSNLPARSRDGVRSSMRSGGVRSSGPGFSGTPGRRHFTPSTRSFNRMSPTRQYAPARQYSPARYITRPAPARSFSGSPGRMTAPRTGGGGMGAAPAGISRGGAGSSAGFRSFRGR